MTVAHQVFIEYSYDYSIMRVGRSIAQKVEYTQIPIMEVRIQL